MYQKVFCESIWKIKVANSAAILIYVTSDPSHRCVEAAVMLHEAPRI